MSLTSESLYTYLEYCVGHPEAHGALRALTRDYNHRASGWLAWLQVIALICLAPGYTMHPEYCHGRGSHMPTMKPGNHQAYVLLSRDGDMTSTTTVSCECAVG